MAFAVNQKHAVWHMGLWENSQVRFFSEAVAYIWRVRQIGGGKKLCVRVIDYLVRTAHRRLASKLHTAGAGDSMSVPIHVAAWVMEEQNQATQQLSAAGTCDCRG